MHGASVAATTDYPPDASHAPFSTPSCGNQKKTSLVAKHTLGGKRLAVENQCFNVIQTRSVFVCLIVLSPNL